VEADKRCLSTTTASSSQGSIERIDSPSPHVIDSLGDHQGMSGVGLGENDGSGFSYYHQLAGLLQTYELQLRSNPLWRFALPKSNTPW
jgi:hypothetical protein